jgi:hypothetical protein
MPLQNARLYAFSGLMFAGKDFCAKYARLTVYGFADPIYELCEHFNGTRDKSVPGIRRWMQFCGQVGWGCIDTDYPHSPERAVFCELVRRFGQEMTKNFKWVDWSEFGRRQDFWVNILLTKLGLKNNQPPLIDSPGYNVAITNARFFHELEPIKEAGFRHLHVRCSEETRRERMEKAGYTWKQQDAVDKSEQMAVKFNSDMPDERVIWNDHRPVPEGKEFLTLDSWVDQSYPQSTSKAVDARLVAV